MAMTRHPRPGWRGTFGVAVAVMAWLAISAPPAMAHAELTSISPEDGAVLVEAPSSIKLTFSEPLITAAATVVVTDDAGVVVTRDRSQVDGRAVTVAWPPEVRPGDYTIAYRVVSGDGHPIKGTSRFTLLQPASSTTPEPSGTPAPESSPEPVSGSSGNQASTPATAMAQSEAASVPANTGQDPSIKMSTIVLGAGIAAAFAVGAALLIRRRRAA